MSILNYIAQAEVTKTMTAPIANATEESSYFIAYLLMRFVRWLMGLVGLAHHESVFIWLYVAVVFLFSWAVGTLVKWLVVFIMRKASPHINAPISKHLLQSHFFMHACRIIPPLIFLLLIQFTLYMHPSIATWLSRISLIYVVIVVAISLCKLADAIWNTLNERENKKKLPLKGIVQLIKMVVWILAAIIMVAILVNKSPGTLLAGIGVFASVLMLIFKDSILGIVAGVQLAENDSLHVGDWISVPGSQANGIVQEVSLTDVKIVNWDKTISTVPPYNLISGGFKNFRNMQESNTRRIQRSYLIDADSVVEATPEMLEEIQQIPLMKDWITKKLAQKQADKVEDVDNSEGLADGTIDTNLGMFRAYIDIYLRQNPHIDKESFLFVTTLEQTASGIPLQIYCFTSTSSWIPYEGIQASVFEHLAVMLRKFHLYVYESVTGRDTIIDGILSAGRNPERIFGMPYPSFLGTGTPMQPGTPPAGMYPPLNPAK